MKFSIRLFPNSDFDYGITEFNICKVEVLKKGSPIRKNSTFKAKKNIICFENFLSFDKTIDEKKIFEVMDKIFLFIKDMRIEGEKELYVSFLSETDQFGTTFSIDFIHFLEKNNCSLTISGIYI